MLLLFLILIPLIGILVIFILNTEKNPELSVIMSDEQEQKNTLSSNKKNDQTLKLTALIITVANLLLSLII